MKGERHGYCWLISLISLAVQAQFLGISISLDFGFNTREATLHSLLSSQKPDWKDFWPSMNPNLSKILTRYPLIGRPTDICIHLGNYMCVAFRRLLALGLCVLVFFHGVCLCAIYLQYACAGWKRASESPEPELQMALSSRVGAENGTEVVWESNKCS